MNMEACWEDVVSPAHRRHGEAVHVLARHHRRRDRRRVEMRRQRQLHNDPMHAFVLRAGMRAREMRRQRQLQASEAALVRRSRAAARRTEVLTRCRVVDGGHERQLMRFDA